MANNILEFDIDKLIATKKLCNEVATSLKNKKDSLIGILENLRKEWNTPAGEKFFNEQNDDWAAQTDNYIRITEAIAKLMESAISEYEQVADEARRLKI